MRNKLYVIASTTHTSIVQHVLRVRAENFSHRRGHALQWVDIILRNLVIALLSHYSHRWIQTEYQTTYLSQFRRIFFHQFITHKMSTVTLCHRHILRMFVVWKWLATPTSQWNSIKLWFAIDTNSPFSNSYWINGSTRWHDNARHSVSMSVWASMSCAYIQIKSIHSIEFHFKWINDTNQFEHLMRYLLDMFDTFALLSAMQTTFYAAHISHLLCQLVSFDFHLTSLWNCSLPFYRIVHWLSIPMRVPIENRKKMSKRHFTFAFAKRKGKIRITFELRKRILVHSNVVVRWRHSHTHMVFEINFPTGLVWQTLPFPFVY